MILASLPATPLSMRGLWCLAKWSGTSSTYTQTGQAFFYNNGTFTFNFLDNPSSTWVTNISFDGSYYFYVIYRSIILLESIIQIVMVLHINYIL